MYDLQVSAEDTSYNIDDVVVHNSAAASIVLYALSVTELNPLEYNLIFERFVNPNRKCVTEDSFVLLKNGSYKKIKDLNYEDEPQTPNGNGKLIEISKRQLEKSKLLK